MKTNVFKNLWRYLRSYISQDVSLNWLMAASIPSCVVMVLASLLYWDEQSHKTNSLTNTVIASPLKSLTDLHPDCSDSGGAPLWSDFGEDSAYYNPVLREEHDEIRHH